MPSVSCAGNITSNTCTSMMRPRRSLVYDMLVGRGKTSSQLIEPSLRSLSALVSGTDRPRLHHSIQKSLTGIGIARGKRNVLIYNWDLDAQDDDDHSPWPPTSPVSSKSSSVSGWYCVCRRRGNLDPNSPRVCPRRPMSSRCHDAKRRSRFVRCHEGGSCQMLDGKPSH